MESSGGTLCGVLEQPFYDLVFKEVGGSSTGAEKRGLIDPRKKFFFAHPFPESVVKSLYEVNFLCFGGWVAFGFWVRLGASRS